MERRRLSGLLATLIFVQGMSVAHAQEVVVDLPNPFETGSGGQQQPLPQPLPPSPVQAQYVGKTQINSIPRKSGGTLVRVSLAPALVLQRLELKVQKSQVKIYDATVVTSTGQRIAVREFKETGVLQTASTLVSENLNLTDSITSIELRAESYQAESDVELKAVSDTGIPRLVVQPIEVVQQPAQPSKPTQPNVPSPPPPPVQQPNRPPRFGSCLQDACVGDRFFNIQRDYREVEIVGFENGTYVLRFIDNGGQGGGWTRSDLAKMSGCSESICVGLQAFNVSRDYRKVSVAGIQTDGKFILRFLDNGGLGGGWSRLDLAMMTGCGEMCVGDAGLVINKDYRRATVVGVQADRKILLRFEDNGGIGGGWSRSDIALFKGCVGQLCVGTTAYNIDKDFRVVKVIAVQPDNKLVLSFQDNGGIGGNWGPENLALMTGCGRGFCVNDDVIVLTNGNRKARVVGIQGIDLYVLKFLDNGGVGGNWSNSDLARAR